MNRSQRRAYMKQPSEAVRYANSAQRIIEKERKANARLNGELAWKMVLAAVGLKMKENGKSDEKIGNFLASVQALIDREIDAGEDALTLVQKLEDQTGIQLMMRD